MPAAGNCEEDVILICRVSGEPVSATTRKWYFGNLEIVSRGQPQLGIPPGKYTETIDGSDVKLTVHSFEMPDVGNYRFRNSFSTSEEKHIAFECKQTVKVYLVNVDFKQTIVQPVLY